MRGFDKEGSKPEILLDAVGLDAAGLDALDVTSEDGRQPPAAGSGTRQLPQQPSQQPSQQMPQQVQQQQSKQQQQQQQQNAAGAHSAPNGKENAWMEPSPMSRAASPIGQAGSTAALPPKAQRRDGMAPPGRKPKPAVVGSQMMPASHEVQQGNARALAALPAGLPMQVHPGSSSVVLLCQ